MKESDKFKSNQVIRDATAEDKKNHTRENWERALGAILKQCHEGSDFLLPVEMRPNPKQHGKREIFFRLLENPKGERMLPAFTEPLATQQKGSKQPQPVIAMPVKATLTRLVEMKELKGLLIDPFTNPFGIDMAAVKAILNTDHQMNVDRAGIYFNQGDITQLHIRCIVNSADPLFEDGGGVDHAIYEAAGDEINAALDKLGSCKISEAKITPAFDMSANYIIHTVGPTVEPGTKAEDVSEEDKQALKDCYTNVLNLAKQYDIHSIAFPAISTGLSEFPLEEAVPIAVTTVSSWLDENKDYGMIVVFSCYNDETMQMFQRFMTFLKQKHDEVKQEYGSIEEAEAHADADGKLSDVSTREYTEEEIEAQAAQVAKELAQQYKDDAGIH